jgi:O-antigen/teichoic acid export membrane protein
MASLKALAGQTIWYGGSNIAARFLNYLLTPLLTYLLSDASGLRHYGELTVLYTAISFANVIFTYGMETAYFRFSSREDVDRKRLFETSFGSLILSTLLLGAILYALRIPIANYIGLDAYPVYISWCIGIIAFDTLAALPFARLRQESRPRRYAFVKVAGILVNIILTVWAIGYGPRYIASHPQSTYAVWSSHYTATGLLILANLAASGATFLLLLPEWKSFRFRIDSGLWKTVLAYALPFIIIGMGGMVNETLDRFLLLKLLPGGEEAAKQTVAVYSANYKLAIFITLFIQAFRMAAEPFFFREAAGKNAPQTYARVMNWFVLTLCIAFLGTVLFLDAWKYMVGPSYRSGLGVVPILLAANVALGIYYNLSVWYKITGKLRWGTVITLWGAALTLVLNALFIPRYGMWASAWATFACYATMMVLSYFLGQKYYPVPYGIRKLSMYLGAAALLFAIHTAFGQILSTPGRLLTGVVLMLAFLMLLVRTERKELQRFPVIGRFLK